MKGSPLKVRIHQEYHKHVFSDEAMLFYVINAVYFEGTPLLPTTLNPVFK